MEIKSFTEWMNENKDKGTESDYDKFFKRALKKFGVNSPDELSDEKKKEFFDYIDNNWKADDEEDEEGAVNESLKRELKSMKSKAESAPKKVKEVYDEMVRLSDMNKDQLIKEMDKVRKVHSAKGEPKETIIGGIVDAKFGRRTLEEYDSYFFD